MNTELVKGFRDYTGEEAEKFALIREIIRQAFERYNFEEAQTPIIEREEFVKGENSGDEAISDIFKLNDKGKRKLALRYEFTFQLKRISNNRKMPYKRFQIGPVFRDEPVTGNRLRQFTQCDVDVVGASLREEAEVLAVAKEILNALKIKSVIYVNNRKLLNEILDELDIKNKEAVIREIDKLDKLSEKEVRENLKKYDAEKVVAIFKKPEEYFQKYENYKEVLELKKLCSNYGVTFVFAPYLARGLSYYTGSIFEIKSNIKETISAGGTYLVNGNVATGISLGLDRLMILANTQINLEKYLIVSLDEDKSAIALAKKLRQQGKSVSLYYGKPSKAMDYANAYRINNVVFVGAKEVKSKTFKIKDMASGRERTLILTKETKKNLIVRKR